MPKTSIRTHGLSRRFGEIVAVDDLNLEVQEGGVYGFLGPNGSGKTTAIRMLLGLLRPDTGHVEIFGHDLRQERRAALRQLGALVEYPSLYSHLTGRENLEVTRRLLGAAKHRIDQVLAMTRLTGAAHRRASAYSLGMRQRLGLALALLGEPRLLILDEPTNGLDPVGIQEMRELIVSLPREHGVTVFLSSHQLSEIEQVADSIGILNEGQLRFQGSLSELQSELRSSIFIALDRPDEACTVLEEAGWTARRQATGLEVVASDPKRSADRQEIGSLAELLVKKRFSLHHLSLEEPSLESLFLHVTGSYAPVTKVKATRSTGSDATEIASGDGR